MKNKKHLIILGAGKPHYGKYPSSNIDILKSVSSLDFIAGYSKNKISRVTFIGGYKFDLIKEKLKKLKKIKKICLIKNNHWEISGPLYSLSLADIKDNEDLIIIYSDILISNTFFLRILNSKNNIDVASDFSNNKNLSKKEKILFSKKKFKFTDKDYLVSKKINKGELIGFLKISKKSIKVLKNVLKEKNADINCFKLCHLVQELYNKKLHVCLTKIKEEWLELNKQSDISKFIFSSKSEALSKLKNILTRSHILGQYKFSVKEWNLNKDKIIENILKTFKNNILIARSSSKQEDNFKISAAGKFLSVLNIKNKNDICSAVRKIISSFKDKNQRNEIFFQKQLLKAKISGVITTFIKENGSPWYVINYHISSDTEAVTKGDKDDVKTYYLRRDITENKIKNKIIKNIFLAVKEIEEITRCNKLDIEFAIDKNDRVIIFQIRPLILKNNINEYNTLKQYHFFEKKYKNYKISSDIYSGKNFFFGVMPDWNPAEIIGFKPNPLSYTLYEKLVTNYTWARQREEFGYRKIKKPRLMEMFCGTPYISINKSFESFIPKDIKKKTAKKLLNLYLSEIYHNKFNHDKIEFNIVYNCLDFRFKDWKKKLKKKNFNTCEINEIEKSFYKINQNAQKIFKKQSLLFDTYLKNYDKNKNNKNFKKKINYNISFLKDKLLLMFAHFARCAFVSNIVMNSALKKKVIDNKLYQKFFDNLLTISKIFQQDLDLFNQKKISKKSILKKYGHLRPGTYDINSKTYKENFEIYFKKKSSNKKILFKNNRNNFFNKKFINEVNKIGFAGNKAEISNFFFKTIEMREYSKFFFSKYLSNLLDIIIKYFVKKGYNRQEVSYLTINQILKIVSLRLNNNTIAKMIKTNKKKYLLNYGCDMPYLIFNKDQFIQYEKLVNIPNFAGKKLIKGELYILDNSSEIKIPQNKIMLIESADPGYDWIFNYNIKGLVTKFGGTNSHMTIRCAELNISAAIGIGKELYEDLLSKNKIIIDPINKQIKTIA